MIQFLFLFFLCEIDRQINYYYIGKLDKAEEYLAAMGIVNFFTQIIPIGINFVSFNVLHVYTTSAYRFGINEIIPGFLSTQIMLNFLIFLFPIGLLVWQLQDMCTAI
jgi:hypothetical protein